MPATELPAGPPPITMTSKLFLFMRSVRFSVQVQKNRAESDPLPTVPGESVRSYRSDARADSFLPVTHKQDETRSRCRPQTSYENNRYRVIRSLTATPFRE